MPEETPTDDIASVLESLAAANTYASQLSLVEEAGRIGDAAAVEPLARLLSGEGARGEGVQARAAESLGKIGGARDQLETVGCECVDRHSRLSA
jgi:HEAT repeat protein